MSELITQERTIKKVTKKDDSKVVFIKFEDNFECRCFKDQQFGSPLEEGITAICVTEAKEDNRGTLQNYLKQWGEPVQKQAKGSGGGYRGGSQKSAEEIRSIAACSGFKSICEFNADHTRSEDQMFAMLRRFLKEHDEYVYRGAPPSDQSAIGNRQSAISQAAPSTQGSAAEVKPAAKASAPSTAHSAQPTGNRVAFGHIPEGWPGPVAFGKAQTTSQVTVLEKHAKERGLSPDQIAALRTAVLNAYGVGTEYTQGHASIFIDFLMHASEDALLSALEKSAA